MESQLVALEPGSYSLIDSAFLGRGELFVDGHECDDVSHAESKVRIILTFLLYDENDQTMTIAVPIDSAFGKAMLQDDFPEKLRKIVNTP